MLGNDVSEPEDFSEVPVVGDVYLTREFLAQTMCADMPGHDLPVLFRRWKNGGGWVADGAQVHETAYIEPFVLVGPDVSIAEGVKLIGATELKATMTIGANATLVNVTAWGTNKVGANAIVEFLTLEEGADIAPGLFVRVMERGLGEAVRVETVYRTVITAGTSKRRRRDDIATATRQSASQELHTSLGAWDNEGGAACKGSRRS